MSTADHHRACCNDAECDSGLRNLYYEGKRLTADAFRVEQRYFVDRRHLLNRAIHGWGVVYGLSVDANSGRLRIGVGLALDACGRELVLTQCEAIALDEVVLVDKDGKRTEMKSFDDDACWLLSVHYAEQRMDPVDLQDPCSCQRKEWDRVCETVRFSLRRVACEACCVQEPCGLKCGCDTGPCCTDEHKRATAKQEVDHPVRRGACRCLCDHLTDLELVDDCGCLTEIEEPCARVRVDLRHGVPIACVRLRIEECDRWEFDDKLDACGPRRLVKRNDLLFDLVRGCDLTRISEVGWAQWHRGRMPFGTFHDTFGEVDQGNPSQAITRDYWVAFSRPVRANTVLPDCFSITVTVEEDEGGWGESRRVPIVGVEKWGGPDASLITHAKLIVDAGWLHDATETRKTIFNQGQAQVDITVIGDYILDCNGQAVDANALGLLSPTPTGNGTPGGVLHSNFRVAARDAQGAAP